MKNPSETQVSRISVKIIHMYKASDDVACALDIQLSSRCFAVASDTMGKDFSLSDTCISSACLHPYSSLLPFLLPQNTQIPLSSAHIPPGLLILAPSGLFSLIKMPLVLSFIIHREESRSSWIKSRPQLVRTFITITTVLVGAGL